MTRSVNRCTVTGTLLADPVTWFTSDGLAQAVAYLRCAQPTPLNPDAHEVFRVTASGWRAEALMTCSAGTRLLATGPIRSHSGLAAPWSDESAIAEDRRRYPLEITADEVVIFSVAMPAAIPVAPSEPALPSAPAPEPPVPPRSTPPARPRLRVPLPVTGPRRGS